MPKLASFDPSAVLAHWPLQWIVLVAILALVSLDAFRAGPSRPIAAAIALPLASTFYSLFPQTMLLGQFSGAIQASWMHVAIFAVFFVALYIVINKMTDSFGSGAGGVLSALFAAAGVTMILLVVWTETPALVSLWQLSPMPAFFTESYRLWWLAAGYVLLAFARG